MRTMVIYEDLTQVKLMVNRLQGFTDNQKKTYAAIPNTKEKIERTNSQFKLAIFPIYVSKIATAGSPTYTNPKEVALSCLGDILGSHELFALIYSYYDLKINGKTQKISKNIISPNAERILWIKNGFFSSAKKPNIDIVCELGNKLEADFVTMYSFDYEELSMGWNIDLVNVQGGALVITYSATRDWVVGL